MEPGRLGAGRRRRRGLDDRRLHAARLQLRRAPSRSRISTATASRKSIGSSWDSTAQSRSNRNGDVKAGWPRVRRHASVVVGAAIGDLDNDGKKEDRVRLERHEHLRVRANGDEWRDGDANAGDHRRVQGAGHCRTTSARPAIADLDGNGMLDIVSADFDCNLYAWRPDGTNVPGFPVYLPAAITARSRSETSTAPATRSSTSSSSTGTGNGYRRLALRDPRQRSATPGWPERRCRSAARPRAVARARRHEQRRLRSTSSRRAPTAALRATTATARRSPPLERRAVQHADPAATESSPVVADINGDGLNDIVIGDEAGALDRDQRRRHRAARLPDPSSAAEVKGTPARVRLRRRRHDRDRVRGLGPAGLRVGLRLPVLAERHAAVAAVPPRRACAPDCLATRRSSASTSPTGECRPRRWSSPPPHAESRDADGRGISYGVPADRAGEPFEVAVFDLDGPAGARRSRAGAREAGPLTRATWNLRDRAGASGSEPGVYFVRLARRRDRASPARSSCMDLIRRSRLTRGSAPRVGVATRVLPHERPRPLRAEPHRLPPRRRRPHRALQLSVRARATAARSCCASRTPTPRAPPTSRWPRSSTSMRWLGLDVGRGPGRRRRRTAPTSSRSAASSISAHADAARRGRAARIRCYCTPEELEQRRAGAGASAARRPRYDGRCRALDAAARARARAPRAAPPRSASRCPETARPRGTTSCAAGSRSRTTCSTTSCCCARTACRPTTSRASSTITRWRSRT